MEDTEEKNVVQLNEASLSSFILDNDITLVNFFAPWCIWSRRLVCPAACSAMGRAFIHYHTRFVSQAPVWEHTASILSGYESKVKLGRVDCTQADAVNACRQNHIAAFPTIIVYRNGHTHSHEHYHGDRTPEAILKFVYNLLVVRGLRSQTSCPDSSLCLQQEGSENENFEKGNSIVQAMSNAGLNTEGMKTVDETAEVRVFAATAHLPLLSLNLFHSHSNLVVTPMVPEPWLACRQDLKAANSRGTWR